MKRIIYHGSEVVIEKPEYHKGNKFNDYGFGFYCTTEKDLAKEWAVRRNGSGFVNKYVIRDDRLKILDLTKEPFNNVLYWISLLIRNRVLPTDLKNNHPREIKYLLDEYFIDVEKYDVIIGYRADDSYFHFPEAFIRSQITIESLNKIFHSGSLGKQYVLVSKRSFNILKFESFQEADEKSKESYYLRKKEADKTFVELLEQDRYSKGTRMIDLVKDYE